jgi:hypothetical protein
VVQVSVKISINFVSVLLLPIEVWGHAVAYLVEALCYKPEDRGVDSR